jgi:hypothetical protein
LSGTGAHHQNGIDEHAIRTVTSWASTMLLHMILHWPEMADLTLWPFAPAHATYVWNILPRRETLIAPSEVFSSSKADCSELLKLLNVLDGVNPTIGSRSTNPRQTATAQRENQITLIPTKRVTFQLPPA